MCVCVSVCVCVCLYVFGEGFGCARVLVCVPCWDRTWCGLPRLDVLKSWRPERTLVLHVRALIRGCVKRLMLASIAELSRYAIGLCAPAKMLCCMRRDPLDS